MSIRKFHIKVLIKSGTTQQYLEETVIADSHNIASGVHSFALDRIPVAYYPINDTIIHKIENDYEV